MRTTWLERIRTLQDSLTDSSSTMDSSNRSMIRTGSARPQSTASTTVDNLSGFSRTPPGTRIDLWRHPIARVTDIPPVPAENDSDNTLAERENQMIRTDTRRYNKRIVTILTIFSPLLVL